MFRLRPNIAPGSTSAKPPSRLSARLELIRTLIPDGWNHCDVATGHGQLLAELASSSPGRSLRGTDCAAAEIAEAKRLFDARCVSDCIKLEQIDHLPSINDEASKAPWSLSITGLGGRTMATILANDPTASRQFSRMILQPNRDEELVRSTLHALGYAPQTEHLVRDRRYAYVVLDCLPVGPANPPQSTIQVACGRGFRGEGAALSEAYYDWRISYHEARLRGAAARGDAEMTESTHRILRHFRRLKRSNS